jgi:hypothetical protein
MAMGILNNMARKLNGFFSEMERQDGKMLICMIKTPSFAIGILWDFGGGILGEKKENGDSGLDSSGREVIGDNRKGRRV